MTGVTLCMSCVFKNKKAVETTRVDSDPAICPALPRGNFRLNGAQEIQSSAIRSDTNTCWHLGLGKIPQSQDRFPRVKREQQKHCQGEAFVSETSSPPGNGENKSLPGAPQQEDMKRTKGRFASSGANKLLNSLLSTRWKGFCFVLFFFSTSTTLM